MTPDTCLAAGLPALKREKIDGFLIVAYEIRFAVNRF